MKREIPGHESRLSVVFLSLFQKPNGIVCQISIFSVSLCLCGGCSSLLLPTTGPASPPAPAAEDRLPTARPHTKRRTPEKQPERLATFVHSLFSFPTAVAKQRRASLVQVPQRVPGRRQTPVHPQFPSSSPSPPDIPMPRSLHPESPRRPFPRACRPTRETIP